MASHARTTYEAECHCSAVQVSFTVDVPLYQRRLLICSCSICTKNGYINVYPDAANVVIRDQLNRLSTYSFSPRNREHKFCSICGTSIIVIPNDHVRENLGQIGINIRAVKDIDISELTFIDTVIYGAPNTE